MSLKIVTVTRTQQMQPNKKKMCCKEERRKKTIMNVTNLKQIFAFDKHAATTKNRKKKQNFALQLQLFYVTYRYADIKKCKYCVRERLWRNFTFGGKKLIKLITLMFLFHSFLN